MSTISNESIVINTPPPVVDRLDNGNLPTIAELDRKLKSALETTHPAEIVLTVVDFREVLHTRAVDRDTEYHISMGKEHPHVSVDKSGKIPKLKVKKNSGPITLKFKIVGVKDNERYYPLAVSFKWHSSVGREGQPQSELHGRQNIPFSSMHVYNTHVYLIGFSMPQEKGVDYKFSAIFQREDAKIAIIDPVVENDDLN